MAPSPRNATAVRRWPAVVFLFVVLGTLGWLLRQSTRPDVLPVGSSLPRLAVRTTSETTTLDWSGEHRRLLLIVFRSDCDACKGEFRHLTAAVRELPPDVQVVALSGEDELDLDGFAQEWPVLTTHPAFAWAITGADIRRLLGARVTPTLFLFDRSTGLRAKYVGQKDVTDILQFGKAVAKNRP